jgi:taurine---2-oxoglutarate transaminase
MDTSEMIRLCKAHTMYSWSAGDAVDPLPITGAEGIYFWGPDGRRYLDFNSHVMSVNVGHGHPRVIEAIKAQLDTLPFAMPGSATEVRARVGKLLAEVTPGDIDVFFFTCSGAEANENAIKAARWYTGRHKILSRYRSYHGATHGAAMLTGDPRRLPNEPGASGFVKVMDPQPYTYSFGATEAERTEQNLRYLEEVIQYEGPDQIAAMFIETITGTNGVLPPPEGYLKGLRALLDRHGILLVCDEVMAGFGRTGKMYAFEHAGIVPDIVTMAKGLTSCYQPLGAMGMRQTIADHFKQNVFYGGLTYNSHPTALSAAEACIHVLRDEGLIANAERLGPVMREEMDRLTESHPSVKEGRCIGLFGMVDLQRDSQGTRLAPYGQHSEVGDAFKARLMELGLYTYVRWSEFTCIPPLCITEEELRGAFAIIDEALAVVDQAFEG